MTVEFPADGMELTHILVVTDLERSWTFYVEAPTWLESPRASVHRAPEAPM